MFRFSFLKFQKPYVNHPVEFRKSGFEVFTDSIRFCLQFVRHLRTIDSVLKREHTDNTHFLSRQYDIPDVV